MALTHRERFILHSSAILSVKTDTKDERDIILAMIVNNRCRDLKDTKKIDKLLDDIDEEIQNSSVLYKGNLL